MFTIITGSTSGGKSFVMENFSSHFENEAENGIFPNNAPTRNTAYRLFQDLTICGYVFKKYEDYFKIFKPVNNTYSSNYHTSDYIITDDYPEIFSNSKIIFTVRDPRIMWLVDDHYCLTGNKTEDDKILHEFITEINEDLSFFYRIVELGIPVLVLRFEDYNENFLEVSSQIAHFLELQHPMYIRSSNYANTYFSSLDYYHKLYKNAYYEYYLHDYYMHHIENMCNDYISTFHYKTKTTKEELLSGLNTELFGNFLNKILKLQGVKNEN